MAVFHGQTYEAFSLNIKYGYCFPLGLKLVCFSVVWGTVLCKECVEGEGGGVVVFEILRAFDIQVCSISGYGVISSVSQCLELAL